MTRELKFRAWDKINKKMFFINEIKFQGGLPYRIRLAVDNFPFMNEGTAELMQYTGLKDKNGKEIYEGDILLLEDMYTEPITDDGMGPQEPSNHLSVVTYFNGSFGLKVEESADYYQIGHYSFGELEATNGDEPKNLEVIGNIYENKDLL